MTTYTGVHNRPSYKRGDTVGGMTLVVRDRETRDPIVPVSVRAQLRNQYGKLAYTFDTAIDLSTGVVSLYPIPATASEKFAVGVYGYDVEYTLANGRVVTYLQGTLDIQADVTL